jgi:CheY-like chemotaxis protein
MIVDDNSTCRLSVERQLHRCLLESVGVDSADEAFARLHEAQQEGRPFDVVLIDERMPGSSGVQLGKRIAGDPVLNAIPRVLLTFAGRRCRRTTLCGAGIRHVFAQTRASA